MAQIVCELLLVSISYFCIYIVCSFGQRRSTTSTAGQEQLIHG